MNVGLVTSLFIYNQPQPFPSKSKADWCVTLTGTHFTLKTIWIGVSSEVHLQDSLSLGFVAL